MVISEDTEAEAPSEELKEEPKEEKPVTLAAVDFATEDMLGDVLF